MKPPTATNANPQSYSGSAYIRLAFLLFFALTACGGTETIEATADASETTTTSAAPSTPTSTPVEPAGSESTTTSESTTSTTIAEPPQADPTLCTTVEEMPEELYVSFDWEAGESRQLIREFTRSRPDTPELTSTTPVTLTATEVTTARTGLLWEYGDTTVEGIDDPIATALLTRLTPPNIRYSLNDIGKFEGISNTDELRAYLSEATTTLQTDLGMDPAMVDQMRSSFDNMTDAQFEIALAEEIIVFHRFDGMTATVGESETFPSELPSPFGGPPFDAITELTAAPDFDAEGCATLSLTTTLDPETTPAVMREIASGLAGEELDDKELFEQMNVRNEIVLQLDVSTSQVRRVTTNQVVTSFGQQAQDTKTITYVD